MASAPGPAPRPQRAQQSSWLKKIRGSFLEDVYYNPACRIRWSSADRLQFDAHLARVRASPRTVDNEEHLRDLARRLGIPPERMHARYWPPVRKKLLTALRYRLDKLAALLRLEEVWDPAVQLPRLSWPQQIVREWTRAGWTGWNQDMGDLDDTAYTAAPLPDEYESDTEGGAGLGDGGAGLRDEADFGDGLDFGDDDADDADGGPDLFFAKSSRQSSANERHIPGRRNEGAGRGTTPSSRSDVRPRYRHTGSAPAAPTNASGRRGAPGASLAPEAAAASAAFATRPGHQAPGPGPGPATSQRGLAASRHRPRPIFPETPKHRPTSVFQFPDSPSHLPGEEPSGRPGTDRGRDHGGSKYHSSSKSHGRAHDKAHAANKSRNREAINDGKGSAAKDHGHDSRSSHSSHSSDGKDSSTDSEDSDTSSSDASSSSSDASSGSSSSSAATVILVGAQPRSATPTTPSKSRTAPSKSTPKSASSRPASKTPAPKPASSSESAAPGTATLAHKRLQHPPATIDTMVHIVNLAAAERALTFSASLGQPIVRHGTSPDHNATLLGLPRAAGEAKAEAWKRWEQETASTGRFAEMLAMRQGFTGAAELFGNTATWRALLG